MSEIGFALWITAIGIGVLVPTRHVLGPFPIACLAAPTGIAVVAISTGALVPFDAFSTMAALLMGTAIATVAAVWSLRVEGTSHVSRIGVSALIASGGILPVVVVAGSLHITRLTPDSLEYLKMAGALVRDGGVDGVGPTTLVKRELVVAVVNTPGVEAGNGYVASIMPIVGFSAVALAAWLVWSTLASIRTPPTWASAIVLSATAFLVTTNRIIYNFAYVNGHMVTASFVLIGLGMGWLALVRREWVLALPATVALAGLVLARTDGTLLAALLLVPLVASALHAPVAFRWALVLPTVATTVLWHGFIVQRAVPETYLGSSGSVYSSLAASALLCAMVVASTFPSLRRLVRAAPWAMLGAILTYVGLRAVGDSDVLVESVSSTWANVTGDGLWSTFWLVTPFLVAGCMIVVRIPAQVVWMAPLVAFIPFVLALAYGREGAYRVGPGDSANRILMHIALIAVVYVAIAAGYAVAPTPSADASSFEQPEASETGAERRRSSAGSGG